MSNNLLKIITLAVCALIGANRAEAVQDPACDAKCAPARANCYSKYNPAHDQNCGLPKFCFAQYHACMDTDCATMGKPDPASWLNKGSCLCHK